jgi:XTP/dITP diphosphohydrolase
MKLVFATNNPHKLAEVRALLPQHHILSLQDIGCYDDIPETQDTIKGNAIQKAEYVTKKYGYFCFADDTGLEVAALNGAPGVYSARYAGPDCNAQNNVKKLLAALKEASNRAARFKTVVALTTPTKIETFEGICTGIILKEQHGANGFGYDPIFRPTGFDKSFAQMTQEEKAAISHRGKAVRQLIDYLKTN